MMDGSTANLLAFLTVALALLLLWLVFVVVRVWIEARNEFIRQYEQRRGRDTQRTVADSATDRPEQQAQTVPGGHQRCEPGEQ